jgi:hypothetical protein|nr:MAG TPA: hypothetical protein [Caudoviricetes sp.]
MFLKCWSVGLLVMFFAKFYVQKMRVSMFSLK